MTHSSDTKKAVVYCRVSTEQQAAGDSVSISYQIETAQKVCANVGAEIVATYIDKERYRKTRTPNKGAIVEPSGKFDDRPNFLAMLERIEQGDIDMVVAFDVSRIGRHFRVLGTLANSLDIAKQGRSNQNEVQVWEASKHTVLTGTMLGLMISIAQEENETRSRRVRMGVEGVLKQNRWPTQYRLIGYTSRKEPGRRGHLIELGKPEEIQFIQDLFKWAERGEGINKLARRMQPRGFDADERNLSRLLRNPAFKGELTYTFKNGDSYDITIPAIITPEQWERVQDQRQENRRMGQRNTKGIFLAQHLAYCGQCGRAMTAHSHRYQYYKTVDGKKNRYTRQFPITYYVCNRGSFDPHDNNRYPGGEVDNALWRKLADVIRNSPEEITAQTIAKAEALQAEGDDVNGRIGQYQKRLTDLDNEELAYNRQVARGKLTEEKYDILLGEVEANRKQITAELKELITLRDETEELKSALDHARLMLAEFAERIEEIDLTPEELRSQPAAIRREVLNRRQQVVRALVNRVDIHPDRLEIEGAIGAKTISLIDCQSLELTTGKLYYSFSVQLDRIGQR